MKWAHRVSYGEAAGSSVLAVLLLIGLSSVTGWDHIRPQRATAQPAQIDPQAERETTEKKRKGFNCLSVWDGSEASVVEQTKQRLRDPDSFEHIETHITPTNLHGLNRVIMMFRSRNGFGGMVEGRVLATVTNATCNASIDAMENQP